MLHNLNDGVFNFPFIHSFIHLYIHTRDFEYSICDKHHSRMCAQLVPTPVRLLCPWDFPGKKTGVCCHLLLPGIFFSLGSNLRLFCFLHRQVGSSPLCHLGSSIPALKESWASFFSPLKKHILTNTQIFVYNMRGLVNYLKYHSWTPLGFTWMSLYLPFYTC